MLNSNTTIVSFFYLSAYEANILFSLKLHLVDFLEPAASVFISFGFPNLSFFNDPVIPMFFSNNHYAIKIELKYLSKEILLSRKVGGPPGRIII